MTTSDDTPEKARKRVSDFAMTFALVLNVIVLVALYKGHAVPLWAITAQFPFLFCGLFFHAPLKPLEYVWGKLSHALGLVMNRVILFVVYCVAIVPLGLILKVLRKDLLDMKVDRGRQSYWIKVDPDGPASRHYTPF